MGDVFGYKRLFIFGFLWFAVWSLIAGLAAYSNSVLFIFARVFQGIGPRICLPNGLTPPDQIYWGQLFVLAVVMSWGMDMSFPAGTIILSNAVGKEEQGMAASLINTIVNYSISLALGFGGTIEGNVNHGGDSKAHILQGYRSAEYLAIGLSGFGLFLSLCFLLKSYRSPHRSGL